MLTVSKSLAQWRIVDQRGTYLHVSGDLLVGFVFVHTIRLVKGRTD